MSNQEKQEFEPNRPSAGDEQKQDDPMIEDLAPLDRKANDVRGGILPPSDVRLTVLPPNGVRLGAIPPQD